MFRGNHRTFFPSQYSCFKLDDRGNHSQLETCRRKSRAEYQNESFFSFYVILLPPFLVLIEAMFQKKMRKDSEETMYQKLVHFPYFFVGRKQLLVIPSLHQQSITFVLTISLASKYETKKIIEFKFKYQLACARPFVFSFAIVCFVSLQRGKICLRRHNCFFFFW